MGGVMMPVAAGAAGAVVLDILWGYLTPYLPAAITGSALINLLAKMGLAIGGGMVAGKVTSRRTGRYVMAGALTVYGYELLESLVKQFAPTVPMAGFGAYMQPPGMGSYNPAPYLGWAPRLPSSSPVPLSGMGAYLYADSANAGLSGVGGGGMGMF